MPEFIFPALVTKQRPEPTSPSFAIFSAPVGEILQWAAIKRRHEDQAGPQRRLSKAKIGAVQRFFSREPRNTIPPAVTLTLDLAAAAIVPAVPGQAALDALKIITINIAANVEDTAKPGIVIDGQHRLLGMAAFNPACRVNVVALLNVDPTEKAFQFLVINNKASKVPGDLLRTLALDYEASALSVRLTTARLSLSENLHFVGIMDKDDLSPFRGNISLETAHGDEAQRFIAPAAIENSISAIQAKKVRDFDSEDALCDFFYAIWRPTKAIWVDLWNAESKLTNKVSIVAMTSFMAEALIAKYDWGELDVADPEMVEEAARKILATQSPEFWRRDWTVPINDSKAVRDKIIESLTKVSRNMRAGQVWNTDVDLIAP